MSHGPALRIAFAGGGTGGHVCPAVAVAEAAPPGSEVLFLGSDRAVERRILSRAGLPHVALPAAPLRGGRGLLAQARALWLAAAHLRRFRPDVVLGLGGFASAPGVLAARALGVPVALFEPNAVPGRANLLLARLARLACVHWPEVSLPCPTARTGAPLGRAVARGLALTPDEARAALSLPAGAPTVLVMGGSQGARPLNEWLVRDLQAALPAGEPPAFVHLAGSEAAVPALQDAYRRAGAPHRVLPFLDEVGLAYRAADLAIVRGGAATLAELSACGLPGVVVPLPSSAGDHQRWNARGFAAQGAGRHVEEAALDAAALGQALGLLRDREALAGMRRSALAAGRPGAAGTVVRLLEHLARERASSARRAERETHGASRAGGPGAPAFKAAA